MAARGSVLKKDIAKKILEIFPGSFLYNDGKEIRINGIENGETIQIKVTLTAAKVAVEGGGEVFSAGKNDIEVLPSDVKVPKEPTKEEKERLKTLIENLGI